MRVSLSLLVIDLMGIEPAVLMQKRKNKREHLWVDTLEVPQGKIQAGVPLIETAQREITTETGLYLDGMTFANNIQDNLLCLSHATTSIEPFLVVIVDHPYPHINIHTLCTSFGNFHNTDEATDHRWVLFDEVADSLMSDAICPSNRPALEKLIAIPKEQLLSQLSVDGATSQFIKRDMPVIACDLGGVLIRCNDDYLFQSLAKIFQCKSDEIDRLLSGKMRHELHIGKCSHRSLWINLCDIFSVNPTFSDYLRIWVKSIKLVEENISSLKRIKDRYPTLRIVATTNIDAIIERTLLADIRLSSLFSLWFSSWRMGISKPNREYYAAVTKYCFVQNDHVFFIDDRDANLSAAIEYGWYVYRQNVNTIFDYEQITKEIDIWKGSIKR
jgi:FMN phosphatase YigB (HAD superfamily)